MESTLEQRVETLEQEVAALKSVKGAAKDWRATFGWARNSPEFDRAMDAGEKYRKAQTYEVEIAGPHAGA
jgi:hypothetical protein